MKNNGGPAFPTDHNYDIASNMQIKRDKANHGMTVRQYYKAAALGAIVASAMTTANLEMRDTTKEAAIWAGAIADAMIAEDEEAEE